MKRLLFFSYRGLFRLYDIWLLPFSLVKTHTVQWHDVALKKVQLPWFFSWQTSLIITWGPCFLKLPFSVKSFVTLYTRPFFLLPRLLRDPLSHFYDRGQLNFYIKYFSFLWSYPAVETLLFPSLYRKTFISMRCQQFDIYTKCPDILFDSEPHFLSWSFLNLAKIFFLTIKRLYSII